MQGLHNTALKKIYSELTETNALSPVNLEVSQIAVPTINLISNNNIVKSGDTTGTLFTTPSDSDFYLTTIFLACWNDSTGPTSSTASVSFTPRGGSAITYKINTSIDGNSGTNSVSITFPLRGILIDKSSAITIVGVTGQSDIVITGYTSSNRS